MPSTSVTAAAPAKVNLQLSVGAKGEDGYHPLCTVFQAVSLQDEVTAVATSRGSGVTVTVHGEAAGEVPADSSNLAVRAALLLADELGVPPDVALHIDKAIPVAGGMAGGSADAAAALLACARLWGADESRDSLSRLAARLGADVPFLLMGGTAIGTGRGDRLTPVLAAGRYQWVFATAAEGLSTPAVYQRFDELADRSGTGIPDPDVDAAVIAALRAGSPARLGEALSNDLQPAAVSLRPSLDAVLGLGRAAGALGAIVSGSGPTVAFLVADDDAAMEVSVALSPSGLCKALRRAEAPVRGAAVVREGLAHPAL